ncbi:MAG TPA: response regulator transcription factor [Candidatus Binatus sp.]|nr:response regulator transcription factor [Candidatus Binatus sp.]
MASPIAIAFAGAGGESNPEPAFGLSNREREVLGLIVEGRTNREIGERLFISQKTVGVHVGNILAKLGVSGRVEAAMVAVRLELVPPLAADTPPSRRLASSAAAS